MIKKIFIILFSLFFISSSAFSYNQKEIAQLINQKSLNQKTLQTKSLFTSASQNQFNWKNVNSHSATSYFNVEQMKNNPEIFFAYKNYDVIYKSFDSGKHWRALPTPEESKINHLLSLDNNQLLLCAGHKIYSSTDQGEHWTLLSTLKVRCKKIFVLNKNVFMLVTDQGMYRSLDQGKTWLPAMLGLSSRLEYVDGKDNFAIVAATDGLYITKNAGVVWSYPKALEHRLSFYKDEAFAINKKNELFIASDALYKTDFNCEKLTLVNDQYKFRSIKIDANNNFYGLVERENHKEDIYKSTDQGKNWKLIYKTNNDYIFRFNILKDGSLLIYTNNGVVLSNKNQNVFSYLTLFANLSSDVEKILATDDKHIYSLDGNFQNNFYQSNDAGKTWSLSKLGFVDDMTKFGNTPLILAKHNNELALFNAIDGENWKPIKSFGGMLGLSKLFSSNKTLIVTLADDNNYVTHNLINWKTFKQREVRRAYSDGKNIYINNLVEMSITQIKHSIDDGKTWNTVLDNIFFYADAMTGYHDKENNILVFAFPYAGIIKSVDGGKNWDLINNGLTSFQFSDLIAFTKDEYVVATSAGIFHTRDGGNSWFPENIGLVGKEITSLSANKTFLFAGTSHGIFKTNIN